MAAATKKEASPRGSALAKKITGALNEAGANGITIKDLSAKVKADYRNTQVFAITGKKRKEISKIALTTYRLVAYGQDAAHPRWRSIYPVRAVMNHFGCFPQDRAAFK